MYINEFDKFDVHDTVCYFDSFFSYYLSIPSQRPVKADCSKVAAAGPLALLT